jgi:tetratricopeptide (TPR) repeat protein
MVRGNTPAVCLLAVFSTGILAAETPGIVAARQAIQKTEYNSAINILAPVSDKDPQAAMLTGESYYLLGDYRSATDVLERAAAMDPRNSNTRLWLGRTYGRRAEISFALTAISYANKTRAALEKAVELDPDNMEAVNDLFEYYLQAPGFLGGGLDKAANLAQSISKHDAAEGYWAMARIAEQRKQYGAAEMQLRRAMALAPRQTGRILDLAKFLARQGRFEESDKTFQLAEQSAPNSPKVIFERAHSNIRNRHNVDEARELLKRYLAMNLGPEDPARREAQKLLRQASGT